MNRCGKMGITPEQFMMKYRGQNGRCKVCKVEVIPDEMHIDHDHTCCPAAKSCGECVRDLLCGHCNKMLAFARDNAAILMAGAGYIERHRR